MTSLHLATALLAAGLGAATAQAAPVLTVTATFEPFATGNTSFAIANTSGAVESDVTVRSGAVTHMLGAIASGATALYTFNDVAGPFVVEPGAEGLPDATAYRVTATVLGQTLATSLFSPVSNLTGAYVDFLGACYNFSVGCSVDPSATYPLGAVVAAASAPEPATALLLGAGVLGLAARRRRS